MKSLITLSLLLSINAFAKDKTQIYLSNCMNFGTGVSSSYSSCVNSNFSQIARATGGYFSSCFNFGQEVDYGFTSCISSNFNSVQSKLDNGAYLSYCANYDRKTLDYSFTSCVNSNFSEIQRVLNSK
jgi:hypothetical protein